MFVQQTQYTIEKIVSRIRTGRLALPDFQRDFVWNPSQVTDLLESITREWPIGSLLLLNGPQPFAFRPIDSAPDVLHPELDLYVLDGQQRVTALYHAIQDVSPFVYFVDFSDARDSLEEVVLWERRSRFERRYGSIQDRAAAGIALVRDFWDNARFHEWLSHISHPSKRSEYVAFREGRLAGLQSKVYQLLAIELDQGIELEALAKIFETLNKTGVRLNAFDLLVAKLYPSNFNLRDEWEGARTDYPILAEFAPDGLEVVKLVALLIRLYQGKHQSRGVRQGDVLALQSVHFSRYWSEAVRLYASALETVRDVGVTNSSLVPNWSMILGVAACLLSPNPENVRRWWLSRLLTQTFAQAANTRIVADFDAVVRGDFDFTTPQDADFHELLLLPARPNGLLLRGITALAIGSGVQDPVSGELLSASKKVDVAELRSDGSIGKLSQATDFSNLVFVSEESLRRSRSGQDVREGLAGTEALASQGIDSKSLRREWVYWKALFA